MTAGSHDLELWRAGGSHVRLLGQNVFVRCGGDGELLLLLHAYPTASWGFHKLWGYWCDDYKLIAPDLPGSGFSDKPIGGDFSVARLADTVEALIVPRSTMTALTSTTISSPAENSAVKIFSESGSSKYLWIARRKGRAPNF